MYTKSLTPPPFLHEHSSISEVERKMNEVKFKFDLGSLLAELRVRKLSSPKKIKINSEIFVLF